MQEPFPSPLRTCPFSCGPRVGGRLTNWSTPSENLRKGLQTPVPGRHLSFITIGRCYLRSSRVAVVRTWVNCSCTALYEVPHNADNEGALHFKFVICCGLWSLESTLNRLTIALSYEPPVSVSTRTAKAKIDSIAMWDHPMACRNMLAPIGVVYVTVLYSKLPLLAPLSAGGSSSDFDDTRARSWPDAFVVPNPAWGLELTQRIPTYRKELVNVRVTHDPFLPGVHCDEAILNWSVPSETNLRRCCHIRSGVDIVLPPRFKGLMQRGGVHHETSAIAYSSSASNSVTKPLRSHQTVSRRVVRHMSLQLGGHNSSSGLHAQSLNPLGQSSSEPQRNAQ
ncbi:uncharacterized protein FOMMEDRAFT_151952 [Fomitiporia mediterranea MF3/22]|uniref:uncharacterized protein n=1 Tax=Fomitiporia mediterranea (strain MF3/22) TaxID=694068 RepID=UPI000440771E|nr:uncharacterized protein FOMMEDRAFT_151952 [Fomitiporia mediterranea MF3/22]EJD06656.1 hypothetical protein FOMMEDRAFT_151952 [Fomitiporia mediterranea MF3/22]